MNNLVAIDPGRKKCGLLLVDLDRSIVIEGKVVDKSSVKNVIISWKEKFDFSRILLGDGTSSQYWESKLKYIVPITIIKEEGSTLRARYRYWELWPPTGLSRLIPRGMILPPDHLDAVAALVLLEDYMNLKFMWPEKKNFRI